MWPTPRARGLADLELAEGEVGVGQHLRMSRLVPLKTVPTVAVAGSFSRTPLALRAPSNFWLTPM